MNISQLSEQLKDVPQNTLVGYAKNPNSVVPQFLALAEIQRRQTLQSAGAGQPPAKTVAEDVLDQAAPPMPQMGQPQAAPQQAPQQAAPQAAQGVAGLPTRGMYTNPQTMGMASGGIVAFADGGEADEDEDTEMARLFPQKSGVNVEELIAGLKGIAGRMPQSYDSEKARATANVPAPKGSHPYESVALEEAKRLGVDPTLARHVLHKETGGHRDPATARSKAGAFGPMQLMPGTAKELGVDIANPEENTRGGIRYLAKMLTQFKDPKLALAAYNAGPGRVQQMLKRGLGIESLKPETQQYVNYAKGGAIGMAEGGETNPYAMMGDIGASEPGYGQDTNLGIGDYLKRKLMGVQDAPKGPTPPSAEDWQKFDQASALFQAENKPAPAPAPAPEKSIEATTQLKQDAQVIAKKAEDAPTPKSKADEYFDLLAKDIEERAAQAKASGDNDLSTAIIQAGFAMMAGSSPYALQNIGAGGAKGVEAYSGLKKQQSDAAKDILNARLGLAKYKAAEEGAQETRETNKLLRQAAMTQKGAEFKTEEERKSAEAKDRAETKAYTLLGHRTKEIEDSVRSAYKNNPMYQLNPEKFEAEIVSKIAALKQQDSLYRQLSERAGLGAPIPPLAQPIAGGLPPTVTKDGKTYVLQSNGKYIEK